MRGLVERSRVTGHVPLKGHRDVISFLSLSLSCGHEVDSSPLPCALARCAMLSQDQKTVDCTSDTMSQNKLAYKLIVLVFYHINGKWANGEVHI